MAKQWPLGLSLSGEHVARCVERHLDIIRQYVRSRKSDYALYRRDKLCYVDLARNLRMRLANHLSDRHGESVSVSILRLVTAIRPRVHEAGALKSHHLESRQVNTLQVVSQEPPNRMGEESDHSSWLSYEGVTDKLGVRFYTQACQVLQQRVLLDSNR